MGAVKMQGIDCILLDIEGTICPISFVKSTLFPYALRALPQLVKTKWAADEFRPYRDAFPEEHRSTPEAFEAHVRDLTERDVKIAYLKDLQGWIWEEGYKSGEYATPLFGDVKGKLMQWDGEGRKVVIYSSGSVFAQKLLFGHVEKGGQGEGEVGEKRKREDEDGVDGEKKRKGDEGGAVDEKKTASKENVESNVETEDLTTVIDGWFDTVNAGLKTEAGSYTKIADELKIKPETVLFLSDNVKEVDAAIEAGMKSLLVDRPGNNPVSDEDRERLQVIESLEEITLASTDDEKVSADDSKPSTS